MTTATKDALARPAPPWPAWSTLWLTGALGIGYWFMHKYSGIKKEMEMLKEMEEARAARDAAVRAAAETFKLVEALMAGEKQLRERLKAAEDGLKKEREEGMEKHHKDFDERQKLESRVAILEKENMHLKGLLSDANASKGLAKRRTNKRP